MRNFNLFNPQKKQQVLGVDGKEWRPPFRPFTSTEICAIIGSPPIPAKILDMWMPLLGIKHAEEDPQIVGMDIMGTFAIFVGWKWLQEGSDMNRALNTAHFIANTSEEVFIRSMLAGDTFPCAEMSCYIPPPNKRLGRALNLARLKDEFTENCKRVFPKG